MGKTSVVERFVNNQFSEKYLTTVGVKVDTKEIDLGDRGVQLNMILWDVAGTDRFGATEFAYLRGASAHIFVADGTRPITISSVQKLRDSIAEQYGLGATVLLLNKHDLEGLWDVAEERVAALEDDFGPVFLTSAKTGAEVERALTHLANLIVDQALAGRA